MQAPHVGLLAVGRNALEGSALFQARPCAGLCRGNVRRLLLFVLSWVLVSFVVKRSALNAAGLLDSNMHNRLSFWCQEM